MQNITRRKACALAIGAFALGRPGGGQAQSDMTADLESERLIEENIWSEVEAIRTNDSLALPMEVPEPAAVPTGYTLKSIIADGQQYPAPPLTDAYRDALAGKRYWDLPAAARPAPRWVGRATAIDYHHLEGLTYPSSFELTAATLHRLAERNHFVFSDQRPVRLFGLRGCAIDPAAEHTDWGVKHNLKLADPDHIHLSCVVGVWRPSDGMVKLYRASTVPQVSAMYKVLADKGWGASLLPTGYYRFSPGTHLALKPSSKQRSALRNGGRYAVLRTTQDLTYDAHQKTDVWTFGEAHNIHSTPVRADLSRFGSNGCQVLPGGYSGPNRSQSFGVWNDFQKSAGLIAPNGAYIADGGAAFEYMLLTGAEAAIAAAQPANFDTYWRLRPGSRGPAVAAYQAVLIKRVPKIFGTDLAVSSVMDFHKTMAVLVDNKTNPGIQEYVSPVVKLR